jgi:hypothetical protein
MAQKNYSLVYWPKERKYSVIRTNDIKSKIADIGETVSVRWSDGNYDIRALSQNRGIFRYC